MRTIFAIGPRVARTRLDNLVLLCRRHHRAVHEGGFGVRRELDGTLTFVRPDGVPLQVVPAAPLAQSAREDVTPGVTGTLLTWDGTRVDLPWANELLYRRLPQRFHGRRRRQRDPTGRRESPRTAADRRYNPAACH